MGEVVRLSGTVFSGGFIHICSGLETRRGLAHPNDKKLISFFFLLPYRHGASFGSRCPGCEVSLKAATSRCFGKKIIDINRTEPHRPRKIRENIGIRDRNYLVEKNDRKAFCVGSETLKQILKVMGSLW